MARGHAAQLQKRYIDGVRRAAANSVTGLARTRVSPNALTAMGVTLCFLAAVAVYFEYRNEILWFWVGAALFIVGSILDILDGALARQSNKATPFGAFVDSTTDRLSESFVLASVAIVFMRDGDGVRAAGDVRRRGRLAARQLHACARGGARAEGRRRARQPGRAGRRHLRRA